MRIIKPLAVLAAAAAVGVPATAVAKPGSKAEKAPKTERVAKKDKADKGGKAKGHAKKAKNAVFKGVVSAVDGTTVTVTVAKANKWGRGFVGQDVAFDVSKLKKPAEVAVGDAVQAQAKIAKDAEPPFVARKLKVVDDEPETEDEDEAAAEPVTEPEA